MNFRTLIKIHIEETSSNAYNSYMYIHIPYTTTSILGNHREMNIPYNHCIINQYTLRISMVRAEPNCEQNSFSILRSSIDFNTTMIHTCQYIILYEAPYGR